MLQIIFFDSKEGWWMILKEWLYNSKKVASISLVLFERTNI